MGRPVALVARAVALIATGVTLVVLGLVAPERQPEPSPVTSWRPATEAEKREQDRLLLEEEMDRLWEQRAHPDGLTPGRTVRP